MSILMAALTCGDRVREIRIRLGMSQSALAKKADVSQAAISKIENNATDSSKYIAHVAKALNIIEGVSAGKADQCKLLNIP